MVRNGKVAYGRYANVPVSVNANGQIVVNSFPMKRKLTNETVARWELIGVETHKRTWVAARFVGRAVDSAVSTLINGVPWINLSDKSTKGELYSVRVEWVDDGKSTVLELPKPLFELFEVNLKARRAAPVSPQPASVVPPSPPLAPPKVVAPPPAPAASPDEPDVIEQIGRLALLRNQGVLTEEEFAVKKAELLARL